MKKIVILGDSLSLPRPDNIHTFNPLKDLKLGVEFNETYPYILQKKLNNYYVINRAVRASTIKQIYERDSHDHIILTKPDIIIIHVGIVDLWPRNELNGKSYISESEFAYYYIKLLKKIGLLHETKIICIGIAPTSERMEQKYPGVTEKIKRYNQIIKNICLFNKQTILVDMAKYISTGNCYKFLMKDDQHLNSKGNNLVSEKIYRIVDSNFSDSENDKIGIGIDKRISLNINDLKLNHIQLLELDKIKDNETVVIYGAGDIGRDILLMLQQRNVQIESLIDSVKQGTILGVTINKLDDYSKLRFEKIDKIVVASFFYKDEIMNNLEMFQIEKEKIITFPNTISLNKLYEVIEV